MSEKPIFVYWWQLACTPKPIKVATSSHLRKGSA